MNTAVFMSNEYRGGLHEYKVFISLGGGLVFILMSWGVFGELLT